MDPTLLLQNSQIFQEIENRARKAVVEETKANAWTLFSLALAGGALGGFVLRGKLGVVVGLGVAYFAAAKLANAGSKTGSKG